MALKRASQQQILADYPQLEPDDFRAVCVYAAELAAAPKASSGWSCSLTKASPKLIDRDFERLLTAIPAARVVILRSCNYPTGIAADVLRRNAIRVAELAVSQDHLIILDW